MVDHFFLLNRGPGPLGMVAQAANDGDHVAAQQWAETLGHKLFDRFDRFPQELQSEKIVGTA